jgi:hypothetical protein
MTALALWRPLWVPRFDPWRLLKPLRMEGQFAPYQPLQFEEDGHPPGYGLGVADITIVDDGDAAPSSGGGTSTHTYNTQTSTGPDSGLLITWVNDGILTLDSGSWNGNALTILEQASKDNASEDMGAAIAVVAGAQSGTLTLTWSGNCADSEITKVSLSNVQSLSAVYTDKEISAESGADLDSLLSPGVGGIRLAVHAHANDASATSWTNATELADLDAGLWRHSAAYDLGDDATAIVADNAGLADAEVIVGVSIR